MSDTLTAPEAAAQWWAEALGAPKFQMTTQETDGYVENRKGEMTGMMQTLLVAQQPAPGSLSYDEFRAVLADAIQNALGQEYNRGYVNLDVDYGPDHMLSAAARAAGISTSRFPWKTNMSVTPDYVTVSYGYAAPHQIVWASPAWERPACSQQKYDDDGEQAPWACSLPKFHEEREHQFDAPVALCTVCGRNAKDYHHTEDWPADKHEFVAQ